MLGCLPKLISIVGGRKRRVVEIGVGEELLVEVGEAIKKGARGGIMKEAKD